MPTLRNLANVNVGENANDGSGDLIRDAFIKINANFADLYNSGQILGFGQDTRLSPGLSWSADKDTGFFRPGSGQISASLNGQEAFIMKEDGTLKWFSQDIATRNYVNNLVATITGGGSGTSGNVAGGINVVTSLPTSANYEGRFVYFNGDAWIYSSYPAGNGAGKPADSSIARETNSDSRWVRFRGDFAVSIGVGLPDTTAEGTVFYNASDQVLYIFINQQWRTLSSIVTPSALTGFEVLGVLPATTNVNNFQGRTVVVGNKIYVFRIVSGDGVWQDINDYITASGGDGISSGSVLPNIGSSLLGQLFRKTGTAPGLYIFDGAKWLMIEQYVLSKGTAGIRNYSSLPGTALFTPGDLVQVNGIVYILNQAGNAWGFFNPGVSGTVSNVVVSANAIGTLELASNAVVNSKILDRTISNVKLQVSSITSSELAANSVTATQIATGAVTTAKIQNFAIGTQQLGNAVINSDKIAAGAVTEAKIGGTLSVGKIQANNVSELSQNLGTITSGILRSTDNKMLIDLNNKIIRIEL